MWPRKSPAEMEFNTIRVMIRIYCRHHHKPENELCADCSDLLDYAADRLNKCPFGSDKPTCENCTIHCYQPDRREQARKVMRFAGPRMIWQHPILAIIHLIKVRKEKQNSF